MSASANYLDRTEFSAGRGERWRPRAAAGYGPVRSFVRSVMADGDLIEIITTAALPAGARDTSQASG